MLDDAPLRTLSDRELERIAAAFRDLHGYGEGFVGAVYERYMGPKDPGFLDRAWTYQRWIGVYMLTDHFDVGKTSWETARETFDRVHDRRAGGADPEEAPP